MHLLTIILVVIGAWLVVRWLQSQPQAVRKAAGFKIGLTVLGVLVLLGVLTGRLNPATLLVTVAAAIPMLGRALDLKQLFDRMKSARGPSPGQTSSVSTRFIDMTLNHDTGAMDGTVREGPFKGRVLSSLSVEELRQLLDQCRQDAQSLRVLQGFIDRHAGADFGPDAHSQEPSPGAMSVDQAREILGVAANASREDIVAAHRKLMQKIHPDRGGSTYLAAQVNQAKDLLLATL